MGDMDGSTVGKTVGPEVGNPVGGFVGDSLGANDGCAVVGPSVGAQVTSQHVVSHREASPGYSQQASLVPHDCKVSGIHSVGIMVGYKLGNAVGAWVGVIVGAEEGMGVVGAHVIDISASNSQHDFAHKLRCATAAMP